MSTTLTTRRLRQTALLVLAMVMALVLSMSTGLTAFGQSLGVETAVAQEDDSSDDSDSDDDDSDDDDSGDVATTDTAEPAPAPATTDTDTGPAPIGGAATGFGGTASTPGQTGIASFALPVAMGAAALAAGIIRFRRN